MATATDAYVLGNTDINRLIFDQGARQMLPCVNVGTFSAPEDCPPCRRKAEVEKAINTVLDYNQIRRCLMALPDWDSRRWLLDYFQKDAIRIEIRYKKPITENGKKVRGHGTTIRRP